MAAVSHPMRDRVSGMSAGLFAAAPGRLGDAVAQLAEWGGRLAHFDVMDGVFVPQITGGPGFLAVTEAAGGRLLRDVHLMVAAPAQQVEPFARAGADIVTVHAEAADAGEALDAVRAASDRLGRPILAGLAVMPGTDLAGLAPLLAQGPDLILVLSLDPRDGAPADLSLACDRLAVLRGRARAGTLFGIDGGITEATISLAASCRPDLIVSGSAIFGAGDPAAAFAQMTDAWAASRLLPVGGGGA